ncbi:hypothetical protein EIN_386880 [Entamoeba invadens IP1]|uniref:Uncharacterized protein n=1 Tax=Entamoeba invadens IP1 TaxID=370355 RepID=A0A0A1UFW6_ENTIV|nr:hypothetical protein EIN_386880 [Entamoeba invadens IP1]ELP91994.1 hypothetical protein EIN_386880 [Entamoeba invadens IP1]|eukprot:XP_004258765.1 hypothetical protein EIN_386880 [Entamoeba invadens IP1]
MSTANIKTKCTEAKRVSVSYEAEQQAVLMWILLQGDVTSFTVQCPRKKSETSQFVEISTVEICGEKIDFSEYIEHFIEASGKALDKSSKNYNKYNKRNHIAAINNTLILLVQMSGFNVVLKH